MIEDGGWTGSVLSWSRTFAVLSEEQFSQLLALLGSGRLKGGPHDTENVKLALLSLGKVSPARLERLVAVLSSPWAEVGAEVQALLAQLQEPHLHHELAKIREALENEP
jgi:hypothetical protein